MNKTNGISILGTAVLVAALATPTGAAGVHVRAGDNQVIVAPGQVFTLDLVVTQADAQFNAFDLEVDFAPSRLTFVATAPVSDQIGPLMTTACATNFHRFTPHPDNLEIHLGLLCNQTFVVGPGVIYRVKFRASTTDTGKTVITFGPTTAFFRAGVQVLPLEKQSLSVMVTSTAVGVADRAPDRFSMAAPLPNPRLGPGPGHFAFELHRAGRVGLDLFDSSGRRVAHHDPASFSAGRHWIDIDAAPLASGAYFARMTTDEGSSQWKRWVVLK